MVQIGALSIIVPILFVILFQLIGVAREAEMRGYAILPDEIQTLDYSDVPHRTAVITVSELLPTLGRWTTGMGRGAIFHLFISAYISFSLAGLIYLSLVSNLLFVVPAVGMFVIWLWLPLLEIDKYDEISSEIKPRSVDYHVSMVFLGTVILISSIVAFMEIQEHQTIIFGISAIVFNKFHLHMTGLFAEMVAREIDFIEGAGEYQTTLEN